jgi:hypothetical protein
MRPCLWWIVYRHDGDLRVSIQEAGPQVFAELKARIAGLVAERLEVHRLDDTIARKLPKSTIGRVLIQEEAQTLLEKIG